MTDYDPIIQHCQARIEDTRNRMFSVPVLSLGNDVKVLQCASVIEELRSIIAYCENLNRQESMIESALGLPCSVKEVA